MGNTHEYRYQLIIFSRKKLLWVTSMTSNLEEKKCGAVIKSLVLLCLNSSHGSLLLLKCTLGGSKWWLKCLGTCLSHERYGLIFQFWVLIWPRSGCCGHLGNEIKWRIFSEKDHIILLLLREFSVLYRGKYYVTL